MKDEFKKVQYQEHMCGCGGYKCHCCGPKPSERKDHRRQARNKLKQKTKEEIQNQLDEEK